MIKLTTQYLASCLVLLLSTVISAQTTVNFNYTGGSQSWTVPACVTSINVVVEGAEGGDNGNGAGGNGAVITATIPVIPGQVISLIVGGEGSALAGGYNGGGNGNLSSNGNNNYNSNGGGGASTISIGGVPVVIAAGGGGAGGGSNNVAGGNGGCASGSPGANTYGAGGGGASQFAGGSGGAPWAGTPPGGQNGSYGQGGNGGAWQTASGGGGGGGYYGGGGGGNDGCCTGANGGGGGGGGSSLVPAGAGCVAGTNTGPGFISITYTSSSAIANAGPDVTRCSNSGGVVIGANPVTATNGVPYSWSNGAGSGTIDLVAPGITNGQVTVSPAVTTNYTLTVGSAGCTSTDQVTVIVDMPPTASNPASINVQCIGNVPAPNVNVVTTEADDYTNPPAVTYIGQVSVGTCPTIITRTYRVTDACSQYVDVTQTITVNDNIAPVFVSPPAAVTVQCVGNVPAITNLGWTDNCDGAGSVAGTNGPLVGGACGGTITRTWTYTDACGNTATASQIITVDDNINPTASNPAPQVGVPPAPDVTVVTDEADNCGVPTVTYIGDVSDGGNCPEIITRTYRITDVCGNFIDVTQTFTIGDAIFPTASNPIAVNVECITGVPAPNPLVVTDEADNGATPPTVVWTNDVSDGNTCPETITRTYQVTDDCGNFIFVTQTITVNDITAPAFAAPPAALTVQCVGDVPAMTNLGWTDNCDGAGSVAGTDGALVGGACGGTITRTWTYTDACGNNATVTQSITVNDNIAPVLAAPPAAVTVQCVGDVPAMTNLGWTDNCDGAGSVAGTDGALVGGNCGGTITRTWTYTDACGNNATVTQTITVNDNIAPVFAAPPAAVTVQCVGNVPAMTNLGWTDNCSGAGSVAGTDGALVGGTCGGTVTRTWTYTDACGNNATVAQTITVNDNIAPILVAPPAAIAVQCIGDVPAMTNLGWTDNCDGAGSVVGTDGALVGGTCGGTITRTWTYTDACGNVATTTQTITVDDNINPTASNPTSISVPGAILVPVPDPSVVTDEADNCTVNPLVAWVSDVSDGNICNMEEITRTYSVTDDCGNQILVTQIIIIEAVPPPVNAGADELICAGETMTLTAGNPSGAAISWDNGGTDGQVFIPVSTTTYTVTADLYGCLSTDDVTITIEPSPVVSFTEDHTDVCLPVSATFINTSTTSGSLANCIWNIEGVSPISGCDSIVYTFQNSGLYDVTLTTTSANGCTNSTTYSDYIYVESMPIASFNASSTELSNLMSTVDFTNTSMGASNYVWNFGDGSATTTVENPMHVYAPEVVGSFEVELIAYTPSGCTDTSSLVIHVREELIFNIPNTFTPDGDIYNQTFQPIFFSGYDPYDFTMFIFNRWGEIVFETHNVEVGWDGTYAGKLMSDGIYTWKIEFKTNKNDERVMVTGHVNVLR